MKERNQRLSLILSLATVGVRNVSEKLSKISKIESKMIFFKLYQIVALIKAFQAYGTEKQTLVTYLVTG